VAANGTNELQMRNKYRAWAKFMAAQTDQQKQGSRA